MLLKNRFKSCCYYWAGDTFDFVTIDADTFDAVTTDAFTIDAVTFDADTIEQLLLMLILFWCWY